MTQAGDEPENAILKKQPETWNWADYGQTRRCPAVITDSAQRLHVKWFLQAGGGGGVFLCGSISRVYRDTREITQRNAGRYLRVARLPHTAVQLADRNVGERNKEKYCSDTDLPPSDHPNTERVTASGKPHPAAPPERINPTTTAKVFQRVGLQPKSPK